MTPAIWVAGVLMGLFCGPYLSEVTCVQRHPYEQLQKNICKVQVEYLVRLTRILCSDIEDVLDKVV